MSAAPRVAVVGAGMAGLACALRLAERGYEVTIFERGDRAGGNLSSQRIDGVAYDVYPHMFADWYANFWAIFETDLGLDRATHFAPQAGFKLLQAPAAGETTPRFVDMSGAANLESIWANLTCGGAPTADMFLFGFFLLNLAAQPMRAAGVLDRQTVNGFLYSRRYATERVAELTNQVLQTIWSIPSDQTSARAFQPFVRGMARFPNDGPIAWLARGPADRVIIAPLVGKLEALGARLRLGTPVTRIAAGGAGPRLTLAGGAIEAFDHLVVATPPQALTSLALSGPRGERLVDALPQLSQLRRFGGEAIPIVSLHFTRALPEVPSQMIGVQGSPMSLAFVDVSRLWTIEPAPAGRTVLNLACSDAYAIASDDPEERGLMLIRELSAFLPVFTPPAYWGDPDCDIDWTRTRYFPNDTHRLYTNEVEDAAWSPPTRHDALPRVYFAGDFCGASQVRMATVEGAIQTGLAAARAVWDAEPLGPSIETLPDPAAAEPLLMASTLALMPLAYAAKWWSDQTPNDSDTGLPNAATEATPPAPQLALDYTADWWDTALALAASLGVDLDRSGAAFAPPDLGRTALGAARGIAGFAASALAADPAAPRRRRWRVKA